MERTVEQVEEARGRPLVEDLVDVDGNARRSMWRHASMYQTRGALCLCRLISALPDRPPSEVAEGAAVDSPRA